MVIKESKLEYSIQFFKIFVIASTCHLKSPKIYSFEPVTTILIFFKSANIETFLIAS